MNYESSAPVTPSPLTVKRSIVNSATFTVNCEGSTSTVTGDGDTSILNSQFPSVSLLLCFSVVKKILLIIVLSICTMSLFAQYNERAIMTQTAQQLTFQRQFTQAEQAWLQLLAKYPDDVNSVAQLFQLYLQLNQTDKAEKLIGDYRSLLPGSMYQEYDLQLTLGRAEVDSAWDKAMAYLQLYPNEENKYRLVASYFERKGFYEQTIRIYEQARKTLGKADLFNMELGNTAFNYRLYDQAMTEYVRFLEKQPGNIYFVSNQVKSILQESPDLIALLQKLAKNSANPEVKELYAISLNKVGKLKEALSEYELLPPDKLYLFANEQYTAGKDSIAILAYQALQTKFSDTMRLGEIIIRLAELHIRQKHYPEVEVLLSELISDQNDANNRYLRTRYPLQAYLMLAEIAVWQDRGLAEITKLLTTAQKFAYSSEDKTELIYRQIHTSYLYDRVDLAAAELQRLNAKSFPDRYLYYSFLIAMQANQVDKADSLINELIIASPSSKYANDLMSMNIMLMNLKGQAVLDFQAAYRLKLKHQDTLAVQQMALLAQTANDEELRLLAADWAVQGGLIPQADTLYNYQWQDPLNREYAALMRSRLSSDPVSIEKQAQEFLRENPSSVFSPGFRQLLQRIPAGRPTL